MKSKVIAVIPARLNSKRFPRKVIYPYRGRPLLHYMWSSFSRSRLIDRLIIATDSLEVEEVATEFGAEVIRTSTNHRTGTDRAAEVMREIGGGDIFVNIQADNLGLKAAVLDRVIREMKTDPSIEFATLARRIDSDNDINDPNVVKVVTDREGSALWFSRCPIPWIQRPDDGPRHSQHRFLEHIGIYFYRRQALIDFAGWKRTPLEMVESLEQLRVIENGRRMRVFLTKAQSVSVDTPEDLRKMDRMKS